MEYSDREYKPFEGGYPYQVYQGQLPRCQYCGRPNMHADCHGHERYCPYYCKDNMNMPLGDELGILITLVIGYFIFKIIKKKVNNL